MLVLMNHNLKFDQKQMAFFLSFIIKVYEDQYEVIYFPPCY